MTIAVTGATGHLGRLVIESLLERGVPAGQIVAAGRDVAKIKDLADRGVTVVTVDYSAPETLAAALAGVDKVLLISGSEVGQRIPQHRNVIDAAKAAGVGFIAYTSAPYADTTKMILAGEHRATEEYLAESGVPFALLRHGWYLENYTGQLPATLQRGVLAGSAGAGRVSAAARADFAAADAAVLLLDGQAGAVYELGGDVPFTMAELAAEITAQSGTQVIYQDLPVPDYTQILIGAGVPEPFAAILADSDRAIASGELLIENGELSRLIGRPTTPLSAAVAAALSS
jgi:NAD(P)H dehydrogenase (quinone)